MVFVSPIILENREIMLGTHLIRVERSPISDIARPGQFVMVHCGGTLDILLPRPLSIHRVTRGTQGGLALLVARVGRGTRWICSQGGGQRLQLFGPLGQGFSLRSSSRKLLLVGGGMGIAPLFFAGQEALSRGIEVTLLLGAGNAASLYPRELLPPEMDVKVATEDGSKGEKGSVVDLVESLSFPWDQAFVCGPPAMYQEMLRPGRFEAGGRSVQLSLEARMGCGVGACLSCTLKTRRGVRQICRDGPVFELDELLPEELVLV